MLQMPAYIECLRIAGSPVKYKWDSSLALKYYGTKDQNVKLYLALDKSNFKAKIAIGLSVTEWVVWRLSGLTDVTDALDRIEAGWASTLNLLYSKSLEVPATNNPKFHDVEKTAGPVLTCLRLLNGMHSRFASGSIYLAEPIVKQAMLARHVLPDKAPFEAWLSVTIQRTTELFPRIGDYDEESGTYDPSNEKPIPRESFEKDFFNFEATAAADWNTFLETLDPSRNPYLRTPEEMRAEGFKGKPYPLKH